MHLPDEAYTIMHTMFKAGRITRQPGTHYFILLTPDVADLHFFKDFVAETKNVLTSHVKLVMLDPNGKPTDHLLHHVSAPIPELLAQFLEWQRHDINGSAPANKPDPDYFTFFLSEDKIKNIIHHLSGYRPDWGLPPTKLITDRLLDGSFDPDSHQDWLDNTSAEDIAEWLFSFLEW